MELGLSVDDEVVSFETNESFPWRPNEDPTVFAITAAWGAVGAQVGISEMFRTAYLTRLIESGGELTQAERAKAFDELCDGMEVFLYCRDKLIANKAAMVGDVLMAGVMVYFVVDHGLSKRQAIIKAQRRLGGIKQKVGTAPHRRFVARTSKTQLESVWSKYEPMLHYAPILANSMFGDTIARPRDIEKFPRHALSELRDKNLVRHAKIICAVSH